MSNPPTVEHIDVKCSNCNQGFTWTHEGDYEFDPEHEKIACVGCAKKLGDHSMHWCLRCGAQFQSFSLYQMGCSWSCENWIDEQAERAQDRDLEREQAWLESYGEEDGEPMSWDEAKARPQTIGEIFTEVVKETFDSKDFV